MKKVTFSFILCFIIFFAGCATITVGHDYDRDAHFESYRTFDWITPAQEIVTTANQAFRQNQLLDKRIKNAVESYLLGKGYQKKTGNPDFLITYHTGLESKFYVQSWEDYYYWRGPYWGGNTTMTHYKEGTLIIDFVDTKTKQLLWRGWATGFVETLGVVDGNPEKVVEKISRTVNKILEAFPPHEGK